MRRSRPSGSRRRLRGQSSSAGPRLAASASGLGTEQSPGKRSLSSASRRTARHGEAESPAPGAGCWEWGVRTGEKGVGSWAPATPSGRSGDTNAGHRSGCPGCGAATTPPENTSVLPCTLAPEIPPYVQAAAKLLNLTLPCGLRCWRPKNASSTTPCSQAPVQFRFPFGLFFLDPSQRPASSSFGGRILLRAGWGHWAPGGRRRGRLLPLPTERGGRRQHRGQRIGAAAAGRAALGAAGTRGTGPAGHPDALRSPNPLFPFLPPVCPRPLRQVRSLTEC